MLDRVLLDPARFLALTAALAACHRSGPPVSQQSPVASSATAATPPPPPTSAASTTPPSPAPSSAAASDDGSPDALATALEAYVTGLEDAGTCEPQKFGPSSPRYEGVPLILDPLTKQCDPLEHFGYPTSCSEGAFGCTAVVNGLQTSAARRVLACLHAKHGTAICAPGVVRDCVVDAIAPMRPRADVETQCQAIAKVCDGASKPLPAHDCERYLSAMRKCRAVQTAVQCLPDKCDVKACLDDWIGSGAY